MRKHLILTFIFYFILCFSALIYPLSIFADVVIPGQTRTYPREYPSYNPSLLETVSYRIFPQLNVEQGQALIISGITIIVLISVSVIILTKIRHRHLA